MSAWERAHELWPRLADRDGAARCALGLGLALLLRGEGARANGWFGRGRRVVADLAPGCAGYGYLLVPDAIEALEGDPSRALSICEQATDVAERCGDADLLALALLVRGEAAVALG